MTIDFKKNRIRIYKKTFHSIDNPEYILLLINPEEQSMVILRSDRSDLRAHRFPKIRFESKQSFEITSKSLVRKLFDMCNDWEDKCLYHVHGEVISSEGVVKFNLAESVQAYGTRG